MCWLRAVLLLSVCFFTCSSVTVLSAYDQQQSQNAKPHLEYKCRKGMFSQQCVFHDVHINAQTLATHDVSFSPEDVTKRNWMVVKFENSTMLQLPESLLRSFMHAEVLYLERLQLEEIEPKAFTNESMLFVLSMSFNAIRKLPQDTFQNLQFLRELLLSSNNLTSLPRSIFHGSPKISLLKISNNNLELIEDGTFQATAALKSLHVSGNKLTHLDLSLIPSLVYADISFNQLTTLALPVAVESLDASHNRINAIRGPENEKLHYLILQHNNLNDTAWLLRYPGLIEVDLSYNELEQLTYQHFVNMRRLKRLCVSNNRLVALNLGSGPIPTLNVLDLSHNHLVHVEHNQLQFDTLEYLYLHNNSIVTLKLGSNHTVNSLTLSHNDWDCKNLLELFKNVSQRVIDDSDISCKVDYQLVHGFCCRES